MNDPESGLRSQVYERTNEDGSRSFVYTIAGTKGLNGKDWQANFAQLIGKSSQHSVAIENAVALDREVGNGSLSFTGHSLGGGVAALSAMVTERPATTFNAAGIGIATKLMYAKLFTSTNTLKGTNDNIKAYVSYFDPLHFVQAGSAILPTANGDLNSVWPKPFSLGGYLNGHSIKHMIDAL